MTEADAKTAVAWASISYAFGFVTVMLHTWRLGFPILELLSAVYVWVGLPLAVLAFFSQRLKTFFTARAIKLRSDLMTSWEHLTGDVKADAEAAYAAVTALLPVFPIVSFLSYPLLGLLFGHAAASVSRSPSMAATLLKLLTGLLTSIAAMIGFLRLLSTACALVGGVFLYVWLVYPQIPQSLGGGKPVRVRLLVVTDKSAALLPDLRTGQPTLLGQEPKTIISSDLELLYATKDNYYLRNVDGKRISVGKDVVAGVVWNP